MWSNMNSRSMKDCHAASGSPGVGIQWDAVSTHAVSYDNVIFFLLLAIDEMASNGYWRWEINHLPQSWQLEEQVNSWCLYILL